MRAFIQIFSFDLVSKILLGLVGIALIHYMLPAEYAQYTLASSVVAVVAQTLVSSFNRIYIVGHEQLDLQGSAAPFLGVQLLIIAIIALLGIPAARMLDGVYWIVVALIVAQCLSDFAKTSFQQEMRFLSFSLVEFSRSLIFALAVAYLILVLHSSIKAWHALAVQAAALMLVFIVAFGRHLRISELLQIRRSIQLTRSVISGDYRFLFGYFFVLAFFSQVSVFVLRHVGSESMLASYGSAFRYYSLLLLALNAVHTILLPLVQKIETIEALDELYAKQWKMVLIFTPAVMLCAWISGWIIPIIDGGKYPSAILVFRILCISAIISFAMSPQANLIMKFRDFKFLFILITGTTIANVVLCLILIPLWKEVGAAIATLLAYGVVNVSMYLRANKHKNKLRCNCP